MLVSLDDLDAISSDDMPAIDPAVDKQLAMDRLLCLIHRLEPIDRQIMT
jgi:hypothetical protein